MVDTANETAEDEANRSREWFKMKFGSFEPSSIIDFPDLDEQSELLSGSYAQNYLPNSPNSDINAKAIGDDSISGHKLGVDDSLLDYFDGVPSTNNSENTPIRSEDVNAPKIRIPEQLSGFENHELDSENEPLNLSLLDLIERENSEPPPPSIHDNTHSLKNTRLPQLLPVRPLTSKEREYGDPSVTSLLSAASELGIRDRVSQRLAEQLSVDDWDYLRDVCTIIDKDVDEYITKDSSLNMEDVRKAVSILGLDEPYGVVLEALLEIGLHVYKYADSEKPWVSSFEEFERQVNSQMHSTFIEQRRHDQFQLAQTLSKQILLRQYLNGWRLAFRYDVERPLKILYKLDFKWILPDYFETWRNMTKMVRHVESDAEKASNHRSIMSSIVKMREKLLQNEKLTVESVEMYHTNILQKFIRLWKIRTSWEHDLSNIPEGLVKRNLKLKTIDTWLWKYRENAAVKIGHNLLRRETIKTMLLRQKNFNESNIKAMVILKKKYLTNWRCRVSSLNKVDVKQASDIVESLLVQRLFFHWRNALLELSERDRLDKKLLSILFSKWKLETKAAMCTNYVNRNLTSQYLELWLELARQNCIRNEELQSIVLSEQKSILQMSFNILRAAHSDSQRLFRQEANTRERVLKSQVIRKLEQLKTQLSAQELRSTILHDSLLKRKTFTQLTSVAEDLRSKRLTKAQSEAEVIRKAQLTSSIFRYWHRKTRDHVEKFDSLVAAVDRGQSAAVLSTWKKTLLDLLTLYDTSSAMSVLRYKQIAIIRWSNAYAYSLDLEEAASDLETARSAFVFKHNLRKWHQATIVHASQILQAKRYHEQREKSVFLTMFQRWRELTLEYREPSAPYITVDESLSFNDSQIASNSGLWKSSGGDNTSPRMRTPRKLFPMSPRALMKWRNDDTTSRNIHSSSPRATRDSSYLNSYFTMNTSTPTKPRREAVLRQYG